MAKPTAPASPATRHIAEQAEKVTESAQHLEASAGAVEASAGAVERSSDRQLESAERRTVLAADRTVLAAERTYAAWVRTGLAALASGVGAQALLQDRLPRALVIAVGAVMIAFSLFCFVAAVWRQLKPGVPPPHPDTDRLPPLLLIGFAILLSLTSLAALAQLIWGTL